VITTFPGNNYAAAWGTSFSAPLVAGAISLFEQVVPRMASGYAREAIAAGFRIDQDMGDARLDIWKSLSYCLTRHYD
jgi:subtilisin family serine protease